MASNYTENYGLCQWEATDQVLREEFNQDNKKVDEALKEAAGVAQAAQELAGIAQTLAQEAYSPENSPFVVGSYTGNGAESRIIQLGATPKAVFVISSNGQIHRLNNGLSYTFGGLALPGKNVAIMNDGISDWVTGSSVLAIVDGGFQVSSKVGSNTGGCLSNNSGTIYFYFAII